MACATSCHSPFWRAGGRRRMSVAGAPAPSMTFVACTAPAMGWGSIFHLSAPSFSAASLRRAVGGVADRNTTLNVVSVHPPGPPIPQCSQVESVVPTSLGRYTSWASEGSAPPVNSKTLKTLPPGSPPQIPLLARFAPPGYSYPAHLRHAHQRLEGTPGLRTGRFGREDWGGLTSGRWRDVDPSPRKQ